MVIIGIFYILILGDHAKYEFKPEVQAMNCEWPINLKPTTPRDASCVNAESIMIYQHQGVKEQNFK